MSVEIGIAGSTTPIEVKTLELTADDGNRFTAFAAWASNPGGGGLVILPGGRGLLSFYGDMAKRFAEAGIDTIAIDYYGWTAKLGPREEAFEFQSHLAQSSPEKTALDVTAAVRYLRSLEGGAVRAVFTIGFSFGGAVSFLQSAAGHELAGVIGCYGWPLGSQDFPLWPKPLERAAAFTCPVLGIFGGADPRIPVTSVQAFAATLAMEGVEHWVVTFKDAEHGFVDRRAQKFPDAAGGAWR